MKRLADFRSFVKFFFGKNGGLHSGGIGRGKERKKLGTRQNFRENLRNKNGDWIGSNWADASGAGLPEFVLPYPHHRPAHSLQRLVHPPVPPPVSGQLPRPVCHVALRPPVVDRASVPEAPVYEHRYPPRPVPEVRGAGDALGVRPQVEAPQPVRQGFNRAHGPDPRHDLRAGQRPTPLQEEPPPAAFLSPPPR